VIRGILGFSLSRDIEAARLADRLTLEAAEAGELVDVGDLCRLLARSGSVCLAGGAESLESSVDKLHGCSLVVAADGASCLLEEYGVEPRVVVTDLDGPLSCLLRASRGGAVMVVHCHGDNTDAVRVFSRLMDARVYTVQAPAGYAVNVGGFTDGDRAAALALYCHLVYGAGPSRLILHGMDFGGRVGWWSKPWLRRSVEPWGLKRAKLRVARLLMDNIIVPMLASLGVGLERA